MYKVTISQGSFKQVEIEFECRDDAFSLMEKVLEGETKETTQVAIEIVEGE